MRYESLQRIYTFIVNDVDLYVYNTIIQYNCNINIRISIHTLLVFMIIAICGRNIDIRIQV